MPTNEIAIAGSTEFNDLLTFDTAVVDVPDFEDWAIEIVNLSVVVQNACTIRFQIENPSGDVVAVPIDQAFDLSPGGFAGPSRLGCKLIVPRQADGTLYSARVLSSGKTTDGIIMYSYGLGLIPTRPGEENLR